MSEAQMLLENLYILNGNVATTPHTDYIGIITGPTPVGICDCDGGGECCGYNTPPETDTI